MITNYKEKGMEFDEFLIVKIATQIVQHLFNFDEEIHSHINTTNLYILDDHKVEFALLEDEHATHYVILNSNHWSPELKKDPKAATEASASWAVGYVILNIMML